MTKDERLKQWKTKISNKRAQKFVKCSHLKFPSFLCPQNFSGLFVGQLYWAAIGFYFNNQLYTLCIAFDKCFFLCGVVG